MFAFSPTTSTPIYYKLTTLTTHMNNKDIPQTNVISGKPADNPEDALLDMAEANGNHKADIKEDCDSRYEEKEDLHQYTDEELDEEFARILNRDVAYDGPPNIRSTLTLDWSNREECWKEVPDVHPDYRLFISSHGRFRTKLKEETNSDGRKFISISGTMYPLDVLVASLFNKNSSLSEDVIHINGRNDDNMADNLLWVPHKRAYTPVISTVHIRRKEYPHSALRASMYSHIHEYIDGVITPYIMAMIGYLSPLQQKKLWEQANRTMNRPVLRALREHYPWLDRINTDNVSTWGLDSITPTGKHVVSMGDNPYNMTYYELDDESYNEAVRIKKERIVRNNKINGLQKFRDAEDNPDEPRDEENLFGTEDKQRQIIDVGEDGVPVDPYGVISRGIMDMRVQNGDASVIRAAVKREQSGNPVSV